MKVTLEFNLLDEKDEFSDAINGTKFKMVIWNYSQWLRNELKHNDHLTEEQYNELENAQTKLFELIRDEDLTLD